MGDKVYDFRRLEVWQKSHDLTLKIYKLTRAFPDHERYGLTSQMRRASVSVAANIVEGFRRRGKRDKAHFYNMSHASADELLYLLILANDLGYIKEIEHESLLIESITMMLAVMYKKTMALKA